MLYALLENGEIKVGPRTYVVAPFLDFLSEKSPVSSFFNVLPRDYDGNEPIVITDSISIVPVVEDKPEYDSLFEELSGPFYTINTNNISASYNVVNREINLIRNNLKSLLASNRYDVEVSPINVIIQGIEVTVNTDRDNRDLWDRIYSKMTNTETREFKFQNNVWLTLTKEDIKKIADAIDAHVQSAFTKEANIAAEIDSANTVNALKTINIELVIKPSINLG